MALNKPSTGCIVLATDVSDIVDHLEGAACTDLSWHFRVRACNNFIVRLPEASGGTALSVLDSTGTEKAHIDSSGNIQGDGTLTVAGGSTLTGSLTVTGNAVFSSCVTANIGLKLANNRAITANDSCGCAHNMVIISSGDAALLGPAVGDSVNTTLRGNQVTISVACGSAAVFTAARQSQFPLTGSTGGLLIGGDTQLYRSAANELSLATGDDFKLQGGFLALPAATNLNICASDAVTVTQSRHTVTPACGTCDTLDTLSGGVEGAIVVLSKAGTGSVTVSGSAGNIKASGCPVLSHPSDTITLLKVGSDWLQIGYSDNC
jgi:hypothetical protein